MVEAWKSMEDADNSDYAQNTSKHGATHQMWHNPLAHMSAKMIKTWGDQKQWKDYVF